MLFYGTSKEAFFSDELTIKDSNGKYSEAFNLLVEDYYL
jgi:hypothetical protein